MNKYRTFWHRLAAGFIDSLILLALALLGRHLMSEGCSGFTVMVGYTLAGALGWAYSVALHTRYGKTLGQMALGISVLDVTEQSLPTVRQAFMRNSGYALTSVVAFSGAAHLAWSGACLPDPTHLRLADKALALAALGWLELDMVAMICTRKGRTVHDILTDTVVVRGWKPAAALEA